MSSKEIREQAWAKQAPDYFVEGVCIVVDARDEIRTMMQELGKGFASLTQRDQKLATESVVLGEREQALLKAAADIKDFANKTYGPDSELSRITKRLEQVDDLRDRVNDHGQKLEKLEDRVSKLEVLRSA